MNTIWRFPLKPADIQTIAMPVDAHILSVQVQADGRMNDAISLWAIVDPDARSEDRVFYVAGTGDKLPDVSGKFIGTVWMAGGSLVRHVFEVIP